MLFCHWNAYIHWIYIYICGSCSEWVGGVVLAVAVALTG